MPTCRVASRPNSPVTTVQEFVDTVKQSPGNYHYAIVGRGSIQHLTMELFLSAIGVDIVAAIGEDPRHHRVEVVVRRKTRDGFAIDVAREHFGRAKKIVPRPVVFGQRHACHLMGGRLWDEIYMECLASEFESPVLARIFAPVS